MGTSGLLKIRYRDKVKLALYCNYDSYLTGVGAYIADFIQKLLNHTYDMKIFKQNVSKLKFHKKPNKYVAYDETDESDNLKKPDEPFKSDDQIKLNYNKTKYIPNIRCNHNKYDTYNGCRTCGTYIEQIILEEIYYSKITITDNNDRYEYNDIEMYTYLIDLDYEKVYLYTEFNEKLCIPFILMTKENLEKIHIESTNKHYHHAQHV
jgi:hypothetical protein